jgi:hypothetical protein
MPKHSAKEIEREARSERHRSDRVPVPEQMEAHHAGKHPHRSTEAALLHVASHPVGHSGKIEAHGAHAAVHGQAPPASTLPGQLGVITNPSAGKPRPMGIPGILSSTSLGPEQRSRMVAGILTNPGSEGRAQVDAVHSVSGHDATAYNQGMVHLRGSPYTASHHEGRRDPFR